MKDLNIFIRVVFIALIVITMGCKKPDPSTTNTTEEEIKTRVSLIQPSIQNISEYIHLNGVTVFQKKESIRSTNTGYVKFLKYKQGDYIRSGQLFCNIVTKEQEALKSVATLDSALAKFQKPMPVISHATGIITAVNVFQGDYVTEGDELANISEPSSLVVQVNVPYEYNQVIKIGKACEIILPDGKIIRTAITGVMPSIDATTQSQTYIIRLPGQSLPENLNVSIRIPFKQKTGLLSLPTEAIQTDEMQKEFWVMRITPDSLAMRIPVETGLQNDSLTEIMPGSISIKDYVILHGAYELADSTRVTVEK